MNKLILSIAITASLAGSAVAADLPVKAPRIAAVPVVMANWTGCYISGGIGYGLGHALFGEITLDEGRVVQSNFDTYRSLRMREMPQVEVAIVRSTEKPTGVGEPGVPPIAPAIANAIARLPGQVRPRRLPLVRRVVA